MPAGSIELREYFYRVLALLYRHAKEVAIIEYPSSIEKRSIDVVIRTGDNRTMILKIIEDLDLISKRETSDLISIASALQASALIIAEKTGGHPLVSGVIYEKHGVRAVNLETLEAYLRHGEMPVVYQQKDMFKVSIDPDQLKTKRLEKGLSLGDLARMIGATRRTVYEYERGGMEPSVERGEILADILGYEILKPIDLAEPVVQEKPPSFQSFDNDVEAKIAVRLKEAGFTIYHAKRTVSDIGGRKGSLRIMIAVKHRKEGETRLIEKAIYLQRVSRVLDSEPAVVVESKHMARRIEGEGIRAYTPDELIDMVSEYERRARRD